VPAMVVHVQSLTLSSMMSAFSAVPAPFGVMMGLQSESGRALDVAVSSRAVLRRARANTRERRRARSRASRNLWWRICDVENPTLKIRG
jgi:hypothetical protein